MLNKLAFTFATLGALTLSATGTTYKISLLDNSTVDGKLVKAGDYKLELKDNNTAVLVHGKQRIELPATTETSGLKYANTEFQYGNNNQLQEIRLGGTNTKIVFQNDSMPSSGM